MRNVGFVGGKMINTDGGKTSTLNILELSIKAYIFIGKLTFKFK